MIGWNLARLGTMPIFNPARGMLAHTSTARKPAKSTLASRPAARTRRPAKLLLAAVLLLAAAVLAATMLASCSDDSPTEMVIGGIPDQEVSALETRFANLTSYLNAYFADDANGNLPNVTFRYQPSTDYPAIVTAFANGDVQLGWFGSLTGVQARNARPGSEALAHRAKDAEFRSVWIVREGIVANTLADLQGRSFTFGSESSSSGRLMPQYFLQEQGHDLELFSNYSFSGSHDKTWQQVEAGIYDAGVLNKAVWEAAVEQGRVDTSKVRVVEETPPYFNYHWLAHPDMDAKVKEGIKAALLGLDEDTANPLAAQVLESFLAEEFNATQNSNYDQIEAIARDLDLLR